MSSDANILPGRAMDSFWIRLIKTLRAQGYKLALDPLGVIRIVNGKGPADLGGYNRAFSTVNTNKHIIPKY